MPEWWWSWWILQWLGLVLMGCGLIALGLVVTQRVRREHDRRDGVPAEVGIPGNLPPGPGINIAQVRVGGDIGGLVVVIGIFLTCLPVMWGWFLAVGVGAVFVAIALFVWHRYHPW
jgi:hypothetical protein